MRSFISTVTAVVFVMTAVFTTVSPSFATTESQDLDNVFLQIDSIPSEYEKYAIEMLPDIIQEIPNLELDTSEFDLTCRIGYGHSFTLRDASYIPLLCNSRIIALVSVTGEPNKLGWSISEDFGPKLHILATVTTINNPANLYTQYGNVYARVGHDEIQLTNYPRLEEGRVGDNSGSVVVAVNEATHESIYTLQQVFISSRAATSKYLTLDLKEQQGQQEWCSAFAGAQILRYRGKGSITAKQIMQYFYPRSRNLTQESINNDQLIRYANLKKSYPIRVSRTLSDSEVKAQINASRPIYLGTKGKGEYKKGRHAIVLRGYNSSSYSVWNPWNNHYSSISKNSKTLTVSGGSFVWDVSIYNW